MADADKKKSEVEEFKSKAKPRTIWDKPDIVDITSDSFTLKWKPSSVPNYAVQVKKTACIIIGYKSKSYVFQNGNLDFLLGKELWSHKHFEELQGG